MSLTSHNGNDQHRVLESIRVIQEILGPTRSLDEVLVLLRRVRNDGRPAAASKGIRVS
jgi:hypothetical protein